MNVLFVDLHNKFRSKIAEAVFKKLAGERFGVKSCGLVLDLLRMYVCQNVHVALNERGYRIDNEQPRQLYRHDFEWADKIVVVCKGFPVDVFDRVREKVEVWEVDSALEEEKERIEVIVREIEKRVKEFIARL